MEALRQSRHVRIVEERKGLLNLQGDLPTDYRAGRWAATDPHLEHGRS